MEQRWDADTRPRRVCCDDGARAHPGSYQGPETARDAVGFGELLRWRSDFQIHSLMNTSDAGLVGRSTTMTTLSSPTTTTTSLTSTTTSTTPTTNRRLRHLCFPRLQSHLLRHLYYYDTSVWSATATPSTTKSALRERRRIRNNPFGLLRPASLAGGRRSDGPWLSVHFANLPGLPGAPLLLSPRLSRTYELLPTLCRTTSPFEPLLGPSRVLAPTSSAGHRVSCCRPSGLRGLVAHRTGEPTHLPPPPVAAGSRCRELRRGAGTRPTAAETCRRARVCAVL